MMTRLLAALGEAVRAARAVPPQVHRGRPGPRTRGTTFDAELAALHLRLRRLRPAVAAVRAQEASPRFPHVRRVGDLTIELEIGSDSIVGQMSGRVRARGLLPGQRPGRDGGDRRDRLLHHPAATAFAVPAALPPGLGWQRADHLDHVVARQNPRPGPGGGLARPVKKFAATNPCQGAQRPGPRLVPQRRAYSRMNESLWMIEATWPLVVEQGGRVLVDVAGGAASTPALTG